MKWMMALAALLLLQALAPAAAPPAAKWPADGGAAVLPVAGGTTVLPADGVLPGRAEQRFCPRKAGWRATPSNRRWKAGWPNWPSSRASRRGPGPNGSATLGPGMHGWVVTLTANGREVGYLIVSADPGADLSSRNTAMANSRYSANERCTRPWCGTD